MQQYIISARLKAAKDCQRWLPEAKPDGRLRDEAKIAESLAVNQLKIQQTAGEYVFSGTLQHALVFDRVKKVVTTFEDPGEFISWIDCMVAANAQFDPLIGRVEFQEVLMRNDPVFFGINLFNAIRVTAFAVAAEAHKSPRLNFVIPGGLKIFDVTSIYKMAIPVEELLTRMPFEPGRLEITNTWDEAFLKNPAGQESIKEVLYVEQCLKFLGI